MAITIDQASLGSNIAGGSATTIAFNTTNTVASGALIIVCAGNFGDHPTTCAGGGLTWSLDKTDDGTSGGNGRGIGIFSAQAPSGLASGTTITVTFSASTPARTVFGFSILGQSTAAAPNHVDTTDGGNRSAVAGWSTGSMSIAAGSIIVAMCYNEGIVASSSPTAPSLELSDINDAVDNFDQVVEYRIESSAGSYTVAGTWNAAAGNSNIGVAYKVAAGAGSSSISPSVSPSISPSVSPSVSPSSSVSRSVSPSLSPSSSVSSSASPSTAPPAFVERTVFVYID